MSRNEAHRRFSVDGQLRATAHLGSRRDSEVISEIPMACRDIEAVMHARRGRVNVVRTRRQVVRVKG
jgi:tRNA-splicing ligase RtcB